MQQQFLGPYPLNSQEVQLLEDACGVYVLTVFNRSDGKYYAVYVGRSTNLRARLQQHLPPQQNNCLLRNPPSHFFYRYTPSEQEAYEEECWLYHRYNPLCNDIHPAKPPNSNWRCPVCGQ
ncbi:hypothetical protein HRbin17_01251 [bacterium HR17]|uniref:GIY-YIG domain-containing protein n=1 Tax=Candidatus Fervidibacter japonicus TaxID=2035412 RepID=A0A2H5XC98_9BACT|nr:hypothetical protein HRbin17_01251 [bacterium HR17]